MACIYFRQVSGVVDIYQQDRLCDFMKRRLDQKIIVKVRTFLRSAPKFFSQGEQGTFEICRGAGIGWVRLKFVEGLALRAHNCRFA